MSTLLTEKESWLQVRNEYVKTSDVASIFSNARFVVMPYTEASQSGVVPLSYSFSKPVIVSNSGSLSEYVENEVTGFIFKSEDVEELANFIVKLYLDDGLCNKMGKNAHEKLLKDMSLEKCAARS